MNAPPGVIQSCTRLDPADQWLSLQFRLVDPQGGRNPTAGSASRMRCFFVMVGIVFRTPKWVSQEIVHRPTAPGTTKPKALRPSASGSGIGLAGFEPTTF